MKSENKEPTAELAISKQISPKHRRVIWQALYDTLSMVGLHLLTDGPPHSGYHRFSIVPSRASAGHPAPHWTGRFIHDDWDFAVDDIDDMTRTPDKLLMPDPDEPDVNLAIWSIYGAASALTSMLTIAELELGESVIALYLGGHWEVLEFAPAATIAAAIGDLETAIKQSE